jgi:26S proteasome regulatory subunit N3
MRLHHNVVKTAVRTISLAYSKITFADIAKKLLLDSPEDAEFIVAKVSRGWPSPAPLAWPEIMW